MSSLYNNLEKILSQKIEKIIPENIKKDVQIFDVTGTYESGGGIDTSSDNPITAEDVAEGKEGFVNGEKIIGNVYTVKEGNAAVAINSPYTYQTGPVGQLQIYGQPPVWSEGQTSTLFKQGSQTLISILKEEQPDLANAIGLTPEKLVKGNTILGIEGIAETGAGIKLFETQEEMQADETAKEGDLAIVYRSENNNMEADTQTQFITFPETVVLPEQITKYIYTDLVAVDVSSYFSVQIQLNSTSLNVVSFDLNYDIKYSSSDGLTYTRTSFSDEKGEPLSNPIDLGIMVHPEPDLEWNPAYGYFLLIPTKPFEGLYEYKYYTDPNAYSAGIFNVSGKNYCNLENIPNLNLYEETQCQAVIIPTETTVINEKSALYNISKAVCYYSFDNGNVPVRLFKTPTKAGISFRYRSQYPIIKVTLDFSQEEIITSQQELTETEINEGAVLIEDTSVGTYHIYDDTFLDKDVLIKDFRINNNPFSGGVYNDIPSDDNLPLTDWAQFNTEFKQNNAVYLKYIIASTQLTACADNLYNSVAYGKDGVIEGALGTNVSDSFTDINAQLVYSIQQAYENMSPKVLSDYEDIDANIRFIPTKQDGTPLLDTSNLTTARNLFNGCEYLTSIPLLNTSNVLDMYGMFSGCKNLKEVPNLDTAKVTNMNAMFSGCMLLSTIPELDTSNVTIISSMFTNCRSLTTIPQFDTSKATDMSYMFFICSGLVTIPSLDTSKVTNMLNMFNGCKSLSDDSLNVILDMCSKATNITSNKTLKYIGLTSTQATKCTTLSNYEAFTAAGWTTGY